MKNTALSSALSLCIQPAGIADAPCLLAMMRTLAALEGTPDALKADEASLRRDGFGDGVRFHALLAKSGVVAVGYVSYTVGYAIWSGASIVLVDDLFVTATHRNMGIGRRLLEGVGRVCLRDGHAFVRWTVETDNRPAIRFYEGLGAQVHAKGVCTWRPHTPGPGYHEA